MPAFRPLVFRLQTPLAVKRSSLSEIVDVAVDLYRVANERPWTDAIQAFTALEVPMVRLTDASGLEGIGFGYTIGRGGTTIRALLDDLASDLVGQDASRVRERSATLRHRIGALTGGPIASTALAAVDVALWDLAAKRAGLPLHVLLGGAKDRVRAYDTHVGWLNRPIDELVDQCRRAVAGGFRALKLKIGRHRDEDEARVAKVREAVGPHVRLYTDANQAWTVAEAIPWIRKLEKFDLGWVEEPLKATDVPGFRELRRHVRVPLAGGESLYRPESFLPFVEARALDVLQPDVARVGGIGPALDVCALAATADLKVAPHVSPELSVVVACATGCSRDVEFIPQMQPLLAETLSVDDEGCVSPFPGPGHGIPFDPAKLVAHHVPRSAAEPATTDLGGTDERHHAA